MIREMEVAPFSLNFDSTQAQECVGITDNHLSSSTSTSEELLLVSGVGLFVTAQTHLPSMDCLLLRDKLQSFFPS